MRKPPTVPQKRPARHAFPSGSPHLPAAQAPAFSVLARVARRPGFTFVELLVVIAIIALLSSLLLAWAVSARRAQKVRSTEAAMSNLLLVADTVKNASPIYPDHRLANYFYVQPHTAAPDVQPVWNNANCRRMSSGEFLTFLATLVSSSNTMIQPLGADYLKASAPGLLGVAANSSGILVDVFEQDPGDPLALNKNAVSTSFSLVSSLSGYRLRAPVDAWGNPLCYRLYTHRNDLNQADRDAPNPNPLGLNVIREKVLQDEQFARDQYVAAGIPVDSPTATNTTVEYVRPATPAYANPMWMSAGPDGQWGQFADLAAPNVAPAYTRDAMAEKTSARDPLAKDNIYSQESGK